MEQWRRGETRRGSGKARRRVSGQQGTRQVERKRGRWEWQPWRREGGTMSCHSCQWATEGQRERVRGRLRSGGWSRHRFQVRGGQRRGQERQQIAHG